MKSVLAVLVSGVVACSAALADENASHDHGSGEIFSRIQLEIFHAPEDGGSQGWNVDGWIGGDYERVWLRSEGDFGDGAVQSAEVQAFYGWNIDTFWDVLVGVRQDLEPDGRSYLAAGLVGLAPYFFETEATFYLSSDGMASIRAEQHFDLLLTQSLVAEPHVEVNAFAQDDPARGTGAGLSDITLGLQLRYEVTRKFAPFVEVTWERKLGETAIMARAAGEDVEESSIHFGLRAWLQP